jgi:hypothetical protein
MHRRLGGARSPLVLAAFALSALLTMSGCGGQNGGGGDPDGGGGGTGGGGGGEAAYAVTDLCAQADLSPLQAVLPVVTNLEPDSQQEPGYQAFYCAGNAGTSDTYDGVGFVSLSAYVYEDPARAAEAYVYYGSESPQPLADLGAEARSYVENERQAIVEVLDGQLFFVAKWSPNTGTVPETVPPALVESVRATLPNLRA